MVTRVNELHDIKHSDIRHNDKHQNEPNCATGQITYDAERSYVS